MPYDESVYTLDNFNKQMAINKEIENSPAKYMQVDIMNMKDFYDAGGYSFVNDYAQEINTINQDYDRALPGYGVAAEQMAGAGLTGSGFSDYMRGTAYAARVNAQSIARQNAMAMSNSFRAAYNQYVAQQKEKQYQNHMTVLQNAYEANQSIDVYRNYATAVGIPKDLVEEGAKLLESMYAGNTVLSKEEQNFVANNPYGLTTTDQTTADSIYNTLMAGLYGGTTENGDEISPVATMDVALASLTGSYYDPEGKILAAAKKKLQETIIADVEGDLAINDIMTAKKRLDNAVRYKALTEDSEEYKALLNQVQGETGASAKKALSGSITDQVKFLNSLGYNTDEISEDELDYYVKEAARAAVSTGRMTEQQYNKMIWEDHNSCLETVESEKEFEQYLIGVHSEKDDLGGYYAETLKKIRVSAETKKGFGGTTKNELTVTDNSNHTLKLDFWHPSDTAKRFVTVKTEGYKKGDLANINGKICQFLNPSSNQWVVLELSTTNEDLKEIIADALPKIK